MNPSHQQELEDLIDEELAEADPFHGWTDESRWYEFEERLKRMHSPDPNEYIGRACSAGCGEWPCETIQLFADYLEENIEDYT